MENYSWGVLANQNNDAHDIMGDYKQGLSQWMLLEREYFALQKNVETLSSKEYTRYKALEESYNTGYEKYFIERTLKFVYDHEDYNYSDIIIQLAFIAFSVSLHDVPFYEEVLEVVEKEFDRLNEWDEGVQEERKAFLVAVLNLTELHLKASKRWSEMEDGYLPSLRKEE